MVLAAWKERSASIEDGVLRVAEVLVDDGHGGPLHLGDALLERVTKGVGARGAGREQDEQSGLEHGLGQVFEMIGEEGGEQRGLLRVDAHFQFPARGGLEPSHRSRVVQPDAMEALTGVRGPPLHAHGSALRVTSAVSRHRLRCAPLHPCLCRGAGCWLLRIDPLVERLVHESNAFEGAVHPRLSMSARLSPAPSPRPWSRFFPGCSSSLRPNRTPCLAPGGGRRCRIRGMVSCLPCTARAVPPGGFGSGAAQDDAAPLPQAASSGSCAHAPYPRRHSRGGWGAPGRRWELEQE